MVRIATSRLIQLAALFIACLANGVRAGHDVAVESTSEATVVRSPIAQGNFLFRTPPSYRKVKRADPAWLVQLEATEGEEHAWLRVRITQLSGVDLGKSIDALLADREARLVGMKGTGTPGRRLLHWEDEQRGLAVLGIRDGDRLYELLQETEPGGGTLADAFGGIAEGFTILDPKGAPEEAIASADDSKAEILEHDYYRIRLLKPAGFDALKVNPDEDKGIWIHLRREDETRNLCEIRVRVHLTKTLKRSLAALAAAKSKAFQDRFASARVPKRPKRLRFPGAGEAYQLKMVGKLKQKGLVVQEDYRLIEHGNGRTYEIQLTTYAGAQREFKKEIKAFWKSIRIRGK